MGCVVASSEQWAMGNEQSIHSIHRAYTFYKVKLNTEPFIFTPSTATPTERTDKQEMESEQEQENLRIHGHSVSAAKDSCCKVEK